MLSVAGRSTGAPLSATRTTLALTLLLLLQHLLILGILLSGKDFLQFGIHRLLILLHLLAVCFPTHLLALLTFVAACFHLFATLEVEIVYRFILLIVKVKFFLHAIGHACSHLFGLKLAALASLGLLGKHAY